MITEIYSYLEITRFFEPCSEVCISTINLALSGDIESFGVRNGRYRVPRELFIHFQEIDSVSTCVVFNK